jgi:hypothetical protein
MAVIYLVYQSFIVNQLSSADFDKKGKRGGFTTGRKMKELLCVCRIKVVHVKKLGRGFSTTVIAYHKVEGNYKNHEIDRPKSEISAKLFAFFMIHL